MQGLFLKCTKTTNEDENSGKLLVEEFQNARLGKGSFITSLGLFPWLSATPGGLKRGRND